MEFSGWHQPDTSDHHPSYLRRSKSIGLTRFPPCAQVYTHGYLEPCGLRFDRGFMFKNIEGRSFLALTAGLFILTGILCAQIGGSGSVQGTVSDPSGAVIPGATVVANNIATGVKTARQTT